MIRNENGLKQFIGVNCCSNVYLMKSFAHRSQRTQVKIKPVSTESKSLYFMVSILSNMHAVH